MTYQSPNFPDYYRILGVSPDATSEAILAAWRAQALAWHPDRNSSPEAPSRIRLINEARDVLSDPIRRSQYDQQYFAERSARANADTRRREEERRARERADADRRREQERRRREQERAQRERERAEANRRRDEDARRARMEREAREQQRRAQSERQRRAHRARQLRELQDQVWRAYMATGGGGNDPPDYYAALGIEPSASEAHVREAWRSALRRCHPDMTGDPNTQLLVNLITDARDVLTDPARRSQYNSERRRRRGGSGIRGIGQAWTSAIGLLSKPLSSRSGRLRFNAAVWTGLAIGVPAIIIISVLSYLAFFDDGGSGASGGATVSTASGSIASPTNRTLENRDWSERGSRGTLVHDPSARSISCPEYNTDPEVVSSFALTGSLGFDFTVPDAPNWSVGVIYHRPDNQDSSAATFVYGKQSNTMEAFHWTRYNGAFLSNAVAQPIDAAVARAVPGSSVNFEFIVDEEASSLSINGAPQLSVDGRDLRPRRGWMQVCAGFFSDETSPYEVDWTDLWAASK